jgi:hypothetical protein
MEYYIDYQFLPKNAIRPLNNGEVVGIEATDKSGVVELPMVGDYVQIDNSADKALLRSSFAGKVCSRVFRYTRESETEVACAINIVVAHNDDDQSRLVTE